MEIQSRDPTPMPEINSLPIDTLAMQPYRIIAIPGGISGVIMEEAAVTTLENGREKPFRVISGISILASMAASARLEPDRPPITVDNRTLTWARPPGRCAVTISQKSMIRLVTPV